MAKQMPFSDEYGNAYETSYWRCVQINIGAADRTANVTFYGYRDAAARQAGKHSIGSKSYTVNAADFDTLYAQHIAPGGPNMLVIAYTIASNTQDVTNDDGTKRSFFDGAENV